MPDAAHAEHPLAAGAQPQSARAAGWVRRLAGGFFLLGVGALGVGFYAYRATQVVPEFYASAVTQTVARDAENAARLAAAAEQFEHQLLDARQQAKVSPLWELRLSAEQVNAWLAHDLPQKFPAALPKQVADPRVAFESGQVRVGCRYQEGGLSGVLVLEAEPFLAPAPHTLGLRIRRASLGDLPIPLGRPLADLQTEAASAGVPIVVGQIEGDPLLLAALPLGEWSGEKGAMVELTALQIAHGELIVQGRFSARAAPSSAEPAGR